MRSDGRAGFLAVGTALLAASSGCADTNICAGWDVVPGVGVMFDRAGYGDLQGASYELCARGECTEGRLRQERITHVNLPLPDDVDPDAGPVRFRVTREGAARPVVDASADVRLTHESDGCGGGAYTRGLAFTREGGLTTKVPKSLSDAWMRQVRSEATSDPEPSPDPSLAPSPDPSLAPSPGPSLAPLPDPSPDRSPDPS
ncbi:hypothetical protein [Streptomyces sp. NPDC046727]|uniref:hypothetical protein n=1 Tax=Streptomyces sp. NPDC046727 TaxID=3155373 RepID=UPI0033E4FBF8